MRFTELDELAHSHALHGLTQICRWHLAQHAAKEHAAEVEKLEIEIQLCKARIEQAAARGEKEKAGTLHTLDGGAQSILTGTGQGWLLHAVDNREALGNLLESKRKAEAERDAFLAIPMPGPGVIPGLADWLAEHFADRPEFRFRG